MIDTKIVVAVRDDLMVWQKLNVTAFLCSGIASGCPDCIGEPYEDASGMGYYSLFGQPVLVYAGDSASLTRAFNRAIERNVKVAVYTNGMFTTGNDNDNRAVVKAMKREVFDLAGVAFRTDKKTADKIVDKLKFHS